MVEVKPPDDDAWLTAESDQVSRYWERYRLVLVTNTRDFVLLGEDSHGNPAKLETFRLADSEESFESLSQTPRAFARQVGPGLGEYLSRALSHRATLVEPKDLAWLLASYARDGLARVEAAGDAPSLAAVRSALEDALGVQFRGQRGAAFFRSTLVQTLFYGVFSAWVLWARQTPAPTGSFNWHEAVWHLRAPVLRALFQQLSDPGRLQPLGLVEVLDWTAAALDRVDRAAFFDRFSGSLSPTGSGSEAVPYFYEPFLEAFDPDLRKQLGVWYTPAEVVRYMVARVDRALKDDLGIPDGLAAENVYVLDPCCGTGAYLAETLRRIAANLQDRGFGALTGARVKQAATRRVFGFEIMPAPFVVAHLQVGLTMQDLEAPLADDGDERAGIFLTNALTGWEPTVQKPLPFPELEDERDRAERVKQDTPILVNTRQPALQRIRRHGRGRGARAFDRLPRRQDGCVNRRAGTERPLRPASSEWPSAASPEKTGQASSAYLQLLVAGRSLIHRHERALPGGVRRGPNRQPHGDKFRTGKTTPDGSPDPSIFSTPEDPVGIQVGTAITTLVRKSDHAPADSVGFRNLWGHPKRQELTATAQAELDVLYDRIQRLCHLDCLSYKRQRADKWTDWPSLPDLFPSYFPGVVTNRDAFLVDIDLERLKARIADYFDKVESRGDFPTLSSGDEDHLVNTARRPHDPRHTAHRQWPRRIWFRSVRVQAFDYRWLYWERKSGLWLAQAPIQAHVFDGNFALIFSTEAAPGSGRHRR